ncbi:MULTISPECIES: 1-phosphofructokinase [Neobacillus]|uniref:Tagatose-6-phosphate kinase n=1 Tax=Neobacillus rhizophilus TaxID=2833579 RepID=A0A942UBG7_9BACI|nr:MULTISPECIES: 1-phosphofructokinase [Neobacillus]MBS4216023.1 1-phosphofructokinase [Neobacillus rhizophilus]MBU8916080.1 1-phosphofructokinase [Bacillus sp. FJAT-29953]
MIYTLTLNPSVDYIVKLDSFQLGALHRTENEAKFPGGKGINVSRVLKQMETNSKALGFIGGFTGAYIEQFLETENIETDFVKVVEDSRINIKLKTGQESEINAKGPDISEAAFSLLKDKIRQLNADDLLVLAGSIPGSLPKTTYEELVKICKETGAQFVVDAEGDLLKKVLKYKPFLIKPNHHELGELFDTLISSPEEVIQFGKKLVSMGAENVIVSLADQGAVFINKDSTLLANVPKGKVKNSVGAGDSMVAGFLAAYERTGDLIEAFRYSVASGSATAFSLGLCTKDQVAELLPQVQIKEIR